MATRVQAAIKSACCVSLKKLHVAIKVSLEKMGSLAEESHGDTGTWILYYLTAAWCDSVLSVWNNVQM